MTAETAVVRRGGGRYSEQVLILVNCADDRRESEEEELILCRILTRLQEILTRVGGDFLIEKLKKEHIEKERSNYERNISASNPQPN